MNLRLFEGQRFGTFARSLIAHINIEYIYVYIYISFHKTRHSLNAQITKFG